MSERELLVAEFVDWLGGHARSDGSRVFNAPYGILSGLEKDKRARGVTFGMTRTLDAHVSVYGPKFILMRDNRNGTTKFTSMAELKASLVERFGLKP